ncbi:MAG TPA: CPBP family glutamic-type intramembrane protease [Rhodoglobus sp.]|nr:CPBP family glutamic-type intramembrane protease [Rhodoglobus sp.]
MTTALAEAPGRSPTGFVHRHPLLVFFAWFFTVGQAIAFTPLVLAANGVDVPVHLFIIASTLVGLVLPALVITRIVDGRVGLRRLLASALRVRVRPRWWIAAVLVVPLAAIALWFAIFGMPRGASVDVVWTIVGVTSAQALIGLVTANWGEELAWTGFVQSRLQRGRSIRLAAVMTAPLFALQHISMAAQNGLVGGVVVILVLAALAVPFRLLTGWLASRSGSILLVGVFHAVGNAVSSGSGFGEGTLRMLYPASPFGFAHLAAYALIALVVLVVTRGRFGDRPVLARVGNDA